MTDQEITEKIKEEIAETEQAIFEYKDLSQPVSLDSAIGRISRMDAINNKTINEAALKKSKQKLIKLNHALAKVGTKEFGICIQCKQPIPLGRILLMPESLRCVSCAR